MKIFNLNQPDFFPYVNGIIVFDPGTEIFVHPLTWRKCTIKWNAANLTWEAAY